MEIDHFRWKRLDDEWQDIIGTDDLDNYMGPVNRASEFDSLMAAHQRGDVYNPQYVYPELPDLREDQLRHFFENTDPTHPVERIYHRAAQVRMMEIEMARSHDPHIITAHTVDQYGRPSSDLVAHALNNLRWMNELDPAQAGNELWNAERTAAACQAAMDRYGFPWRVRVVKEMGAKAMVDNLVHEFWLRADAEFAESAITMLIVHEIGTHVLRSANGNLQPLRIFGTGLPNYQLTEEGLAEFTEEQEQCFLEDTHRRISARCVAVDMSFSKPFTDVFAALLAYYDAPKAYDIVLRAKLGIADTSVPGVFTKDYTYLHGLDLLREFFAVNPELEQRTPLFAGKIGLDDIPLVSELIDARYLLPPRYLPDFLTRLAK